MVGRMATARDGRAMIGAIVTAILLGGSTGMAQESDAAPPGWGSICEALELAETQKDRVLAARSCSLALERLLGPDDKQLVSHYGQIAERLASFSASDAASAALPYRRRAHAAALRLYGEKTPEAGAASLHYARAKILAGQCKPNAPEALALLKKAEQGMRAAKGAARLNGLRAVARGYADSFAFSDAASLLLDAGGEDGHALGALDWERIGVWRHRIGAAKLAAQAFSRALLQNPPKGDRLRIRQSLKQALFEAGDLEALRALPK